MYRFRFVLAVLVFLGAFGFGAQRYPEEEFMLTTKEARQQAFFEALFSAYNLAGLRNWQGARIGPTPTPIYDVNGHALFWSSQW